MATEGAPVKDFPEFNWQDKDSRAKEKAWWDKARAESRRFIKFPVADGQAVYEVRGQKRYTLHHVPVGDAWHISGAHIRGLRKDDIDNLIKSEEFLRQMFGASKMALR